MFSRTKPKIASSSSVTPLNSNGDTPMNKPPEVYRSNPFVLDDMKNGYEVIHCEEDVLKFTNIDSSVIIV